MGTQSMKTEAPLLDTIDDDILELTEQVQPDDDDEIVDLLDIVLDADQPGTQSSAGDAPEFSPAAGIGLKDDDRLCEEEGIIDLSDAIEADDSVEPEMCSTDDDDGMNLDELLNFSEKQPDMTLPVEMPPQPDFQNESNVLPANQDIKTAFTDVNWSVDSSDIIATDTESVLNEIDGGDFGKPESNPPDLTPSLADESGIDQFFNEKDLDLLDEVGLGLPDSPKSSDIIIPLKTLSFLDDIGVEVDPSEAALPMNSEKAVLTPETENDAIPDDSGILANITNDQIEAALERVIHRMFREKIETALETIVSQVVREEIRHIKLLLMDEMEKTEE